MLELMLKEYPGYNMFYLRKLYKEHILADSESESDEEFEQFMDILNGLDCLRGINYIRIIKQINKLLEIKEKNKTELKMLHNYLSKIGLNSDGNKKSETSMFTKKKV